MATGRGIITSGRQAYPVIITMSLNVPSPCIRVVTDQLDTQNRRNTSRILFTSNTTSIGANLSGLNRNAVNCLDRISVTTVKGVRQDVESEFYFFLHAFSPLFVPFFFRRQKRQPHQPAASATTVITAGPSHFAAVSLRNSENALL